MQIGKVSADSGAESPVLHRLSRGLLLPQFASSAARVNHPSEENEPEKENGGEYTHYYSGRVGTCVEIRRRDRSNDPCKKLSQDSAKIKNQQYEHNFYQRSHLSNKSGRMHRVRFVKAIRVV